MNPPPFLALTTMRKMKRILVAVVGATVLAIGVALVVLPGPAFLVIPAGLAILAIEFAWAARWLRSAKDFVKRNSKFISGRGNTNEGSTKESAPLAEALSPIESEELSRFEEEGGRAAPIRDRVDVPRDNGVWGGGPRRIKNKITHE